MSKLILLNPFAPKKSQKKKFSVILQNAEKQIVPRESTAKGVSFEWQYLRIFFPDSKDRKHCRLDHSLEERIHGWATNSIIFYFSSGKLTYIFRRVAGLRCNLLWLSGTSSYHFYPLLQMCLEKYKKSISCVLRWLFVSPMHSSAHTQHL